MRSYEKHELDIVRSLAAKFGISPVRIDKSGPLYKESDVLLTMVQRIATNTFFRERTMTKDAEAAIENLDEVTKALKTAFDRLKSHEEQFTEGAKKASGTVRAAADNLASGLARVEKTANFDRLDRMVGLLERAAKAMNDLAALEREGKLDKIAASLK